MSFFDVDVISNQTQTVGDRGFKGDDEAVFSGNAELHAIHCVIGTRSIQTSSESAAFCTV